MAKRSAKIDPLTEGRRNIITSLIEMYDIKTAEDIQEALKDLLGGTIREMMEAEMSEHLGYESHERSTNTNARNGRKSKMVRTSFGEMEVEVPQDRDSTFAPKIVKKRQKDITEIDQKIISMYGRGLTTRQISDQIEEIYGFDVSESFVSRVTDKIVQDIEDWQQRPLSEVYPIVFIDAVHFSVRGENNVVSKLAAYVMLGINTDGQKEVIALQIGQNESSKYWLGLLNDIKNRGVRDIMVICADGLSGIKEAIATAYPNAEYQRCIVHQVRNTLKYVSYKDKKSFANDLKSIYHAPTEEIGYERLQSVRKKWETYYPNSMKSWESNWDAISPIFKFSSAVRKIIYTTNAIESLNSSYKRLNSQRSVFPSPVALLKSLYLSTIQATSKWTMPLRDWGKVYGEFAIMYEGRL